MEVFDWAAEGVTLAVTGVPLFDLRKQDELDKAREKLCNMLAKKQLPVVRNTPFGYMPEGIMQVKVSDSEVFEYFDGHHEDFKKEPTQGSVPRKTFKVLSYRWSKDRLRQLADGTMVTAYYTGDWMWIDCYAHLNHPKARLQCLQSMGVVFRRNEVFLDYFWGDDPNWRTSCRRGWMWQEQSVGIANWHGKCHDLEMMSEAFRIKMTGTRRQQYWLCRFREWRERVHADHTKRGTLLQRVADCMAREDVSFLRLNVDPTLIQGYIWAIAQAEYSYGVYAASELQQEWRESDKPGDLTGLWPFSTMDRPTESSETASSSSAEETIESLVDQRFTVGLEWVWSVLSTKLQASDIIEGGVRHFYSSAEYTDPLDPPNACFGFTELRPLSFHVVQDVLAARLDALMMDGHALDVWVPFVHARGKTNPLNCNVVAISSEPSTIRGRDVYKLITSTTPHRKPAYVPQAPGGVVTIIGVTEQVWVAWPDRVEEVTADGAVAKADRAVFLGVRYVAEGRDVKVFLLASTVEGGSISVELTGEAWLDLREAVPPHLRRGFAKPATLNEEQEEYLWELRVKGLCPKDHLGPPKSMDYIRNPPGPAAAVEDHALVSH